MKERKRERKKGIAACNHSALTRGCHHTDNLIFKVLAVIAWNGTLRMPFKNTETGLSMRRSLLLMAF